MTETVPTMMGEVGTNMAGDGEAAANVVRPRIHMWLWCKA